MRAEERTIEATPAAGPPAAGPSEDRPHGVFTDAVYARRRRVRSEGECTMGRLAWLSACWPHAVAVAVVAGHRAPDRDCACHGKSHRDHGAVADRQRRQRRRRHRRPPPPRFLRRPRTPSPPPSPTALTPRSRRRPHARRPAFTAACRWQASRPTTVPTPTPLPTSTPTQTPLSGPIVSAFGIADGSGTFNRIGRHGCARPPDLRAPGRSGIRHLRRGSSGDQPLARRYRSPRVASRRPEPGSRTCRSRAATISATAASRCATTRFRTWVAFRKSSPADFSPVQSVSDALNDWSCRFKVYSETDFACTQDSSGNFLFGSPTSTVQFCTLVNDTMTFPAGNTS